MGQKMHADTDRRKQARDDERVSGGGREKHVMKCSQDFKSGGVWVVGRAGPKGAFLLGTHGRDFYLAKRWLKCRSPYHGKVKLALS